MKKYLIVLIMSVVCCVIFAGCENKKEYTQKDSGSMVKGREKNITSSPVSNTPTPDRKESTPTPKLEQDEIKVCFIGNSLIQYGCQSYFLSDIALSYGKNVSVDKIVYGGSFLSDYLKGTYMSPDTVKKRLKKADIVVFQDYGGWQGDNTVRSIKKLEKWCKKDAKFYYYMYEYDDKEMGDSDYKKLRKLDLEFIPKGQMMDALYEMSYSYEDLHLGGDFHPNNFNGYMSALVMYGAIFGDKCADFPREWFMEDKTEELSQPVDRIREKLHGNSEDEIWKEFIHICKKADQLIKNAQEL